MFSVFLNDLHFSKDALLAAGSPGVGEETQGRRELVKDECGIVQGHAYSILRVVEERDINGTHQLLQLRDPWGKTEWSGAWCKHDRKRWTKRMQKRLGFRPRYEGSRYTPFLSSGGFRTTKPEENKEDRERGSFWISLVDFTKHLKWLYVCQLFDPSEWKHKSAKGAWIGERAGGPPNQPRAKFNPQFKITLSEDQEQQSSSVSLFFSITNLTCIQELQRNSAANVYDGNSYDR